MELSGPAVRRLLAKGVGLDLHPRVFAMGETALTPRRRTVTPLVCGCHCTVGAWADTAATGGDLDISAVTSVSGAAAMIEQL